MASAEAPGDDEGGFTIDLREGKQRASDGGVLVCNLLDDDDDDEEDNGEAEEEAEEEEDVEFLEPQIAAESQEPKALTSTKRKTAAKEPPKSDGLDSTSPSTEWQARLAKMRQKKEGAENGTDSGKVSQVSQASKQPPSGAPAAGMSELEKRLADARFRQQQVQEEERIKAEEQRKAEELRKHADENPSWSSSSNRTLHPPAPHAKKKEIEDKGPPFHSHAYLDSIIEKKSDLIFNRFTTDCFKAYDANQDDALCASELFDLAKGLHAVLGCAAPPERVVKEIREKVLGTGVDVVKRTDFIPFFLELMAKAKFKMRTGKMFEQKEERSVSSVSGVSGGWELSECEEFPVGVTVDVISYKRVHTAFSEGAKKLRLKKYRAEEDRFPPRIGLVVAGSYRFLAPSRSGVQSGSYVVAVRSDFDGEEYLVDSRGIQLSESPDGEEKESYDRARAEAKSVGVCLTVRQVLYSFEEQQVELNPRSISAEECARINQRKSLASPKPSGS